MPYPSHIADRHVLYMLCMAQCMCRQSTL